MSQFGITPYVAGGNALYLPRRGGFQQTGPGGSSLNVDARGDASYQPGHVTLFNGTGPLPRPSRAPVAQAAPFSGYIPGPSTPPVAPPAQDPSVAAPGKMHSQNFLNSVAINNGRAPMVQPAIPGGPPTLSQTQKAATAAALTARSTAFKNYIGNPNSPYMSPDDALRGANEDVGLIPRPSSLGGPTTQPAVPQPGAVASPDAIPAGDTGRYFPQPSGGLSRDDSATGTFTKPHVTQDGALRPAEEYHRFGEPAPGKDASANQLTNEQAQAMWNVVREHNPDPSRWAQQFVATVGHYGINEGQALNLIRGWSENNTALQGEFAQGPATTRTVPAQAQATIPPGNGKGGVATLPNGQQVALDPNGQRVGNPIGQVAPLPPQTQVVPPEMARQPRGFTPINQPPASPALAAAGRSVQGMATGKYPPTPAQPAAAAAPATQPAPQAAITDADVTFTAQKYGMTPDQVRAKLGI
jgi:hypothetical protein